MTAAESMPPLTKTMLISLAVASGVALAVMSYFGGFDAFPDALIQYSASTIGLFADIGVPVFLFCMVFFFKRRQWFCFLLAAVFWIACSVFTVKQSATWLAHKLDAAQHPTEQAKKAANLTATHTQTDLETERKNLMAAQDLALKGATQTIRENADRKVKEARGNIKKLEQEQVTTETTATNAETNAPVKSPLVDYEVLATFILWALSQGCWFMASASAEASAEREPVQGQSGPHGPSETPSPRKTRKFVEPVQGGATVINMRRSKVAIDYRSMNDLERFKMVHDQRFKGMGQREIAAQLGWSKSAVQRAQSYKPGPIHAVA